MGRKSGARTSTGFSHELLLGRLRAFSESTHHRRTLDDTVDYLRSSFPEYARFKLHPFSDTVANLLSELFHGRDGGEVVKNNNINKRRPNPSPLPPSKPPNRSGGGGGGEGGGSDTLQSPLRKKFKNADEKEERLSRRETQHLRCLRRRLQGRGNPGASSSSSSSCSDNEDDNDGALSDAIYGEKVEPEFDFMRSQLRMAYSKKKALRESSVGMNVEVDEVREKAKRVELVDGMKMGAGSRLELKVSGSREVKVQDGPFFRDLGGMEGVLEELKMEVVVPLYHPQLPQRLGVRPMAGILLHGPPGCGKTKLAHAIANETGVPFYKISATEVVSGVSGASEENIRDLFSKAYRSAPSIVFIDEIDAIASKRDNLHREMERRIVTQLLTCMDGSRQLKQPVHSDLNLEHTNHVPGYVLVIGATNRPDALDPALRRPGRFDREIVLGVPDEKARIQILSVLTSNIRVEGSFDLTKIARSTPGFVGADLDALVNKAGNHAMKRIIDRRRFELSNEPIDEEHKIDWWRRPWLPEEMENLSITMTDFQEAAKMIQPSSRREGFSAVPNVNWENVGGLDFLRQEFDRYIVRQIKYPDWYKEFGVDLETGFLLYGPPGCGKTLIAKAVANEAGANFIHIKGPELLNKYVGESELAVRTIFSRARTCSPCILFFDEVDALTTKRGKEGGWVVERLLNQLLIELDGADTRHGVFVIGATNRPEVMDRAVLRPGRFGKLIYVPLPSPHERGLILKALARKKPIDAGVDLIAIGQMEACENLSGADLAALMNEAAMTALEDKLISASSSSESTSLTINMTHFERALKKVSPSVSDKQKRYYQNLSVDFSAS